MIDFLIKFNSFSEIGFCLLRTLLFVVHTIQFDFLYVLINDILVIANRLDPNKLVFAMNFLFQLLGDMTSSLIRSIRAIEDGYLVVFFIYETY